MMDNPYNPIPNWRGSEIRVTAKLVPRFLWSTASIDVFIKNKCILQTGGQLKITGAYSTSFTDDAGGHHRAELAWGRASLRSFPFRLQIDGEPIADSRVKIENWPLVFLLPGLLLLMLGACILCFISQLP